VRAMKADGHDDVEQAQVILDGFLESLQLSMEYRALVKREIERGS